MHNHTKRLYAKLAVQSRGELLALFVVHDAAAIDALVSSRLRDLAAVKAPSL